MSKARCKNCERACKVFTYKTNPLPPLFVLRETCKILGIVTTYAVIMQIQSTFASLQVGEGDNFRDRFCTRFECQRWDFQTTLLWKSLPPGWLVPALILYF